MHKCVGNLTIIGSDNGLLPAQCQAIIQSKKFIYGITSPHLDAFYNPFNTSPHWNFTCPQWLLPAFGRWAGVIVVDWLSEPMLEYCWLGTNFSIILIEIHTFSFKKMHLKQSSVKWRPFVSASVCQSVTMTWSWASILTSVCHTLIHLLDLRSWQWQNDFLCELTTFWIGCTDLLTFLCVYIYTCIYICMYLLDAESHKQGWCMRGIV